MSKSMSLIKNLLIVLLISVVTLKVVDIGFGLFLSNQVQNASLTKGTDRSIVLREINPNQSASIRPNNNYMKDVENLEQTNYEINIDENGFIDNGNPKVLDPEIKVLFLGGSTTETLFVPEKNRFPSVIERNLRSELTKTVNVFNGGVSGNHSMHSVFVLLAKGIPLKPNFAVLMHNINDFALLSKTETYWDAPKSRSLVVNNIDGNFTTIEDSSRNIFFNFVKTAKDSLAPNLYTYLRPRLFADIQFHRDEFEGFTKNFDDLNLQLIEEQFRSSITSFVRLSRAWNIEPILMTQGNRIDPSLEYFQKWYLRYQRGEMSPKEFSDLYKRNNEILREIALQENVDLIDLDLLIPKSNEFLYDTIHLNEAGSILMADIVSNRLLELIQN